ncbi:hypothetical protein [Herbiconiux sp. UC225_62]|uniref:hypothetical protein n=1 Tax=Herbiconiux sp. UC225_62 TaxID=3350168 RepID=UPI0036D3E84C
MSLVDGNDLSEWEEGLFDRDNENSVSLLFRLLWIFTQLRAEGIYVHLNEAGRPFGVFSDIAIGRNRGSASQTFSGRSTVCYQYGRYLLWLATGGDEGTPSAANPYSGVYASKHTVGVAADIDCSDYDRLDYWAERAGMKRAISSEIWHYEIYRDADPDIDFRPFSKIVTAVFGGGSTTAGEHSAPFDNRTPEEKEWDEIMANAQDLLNALGSIAALLGQMALDDSTKNAGILRNYDDEKGTNVASALIYPDMTAVRLNSTMDVTALELAHVTAYGLQPTNYDNSDIAKRFPGQMDRKSWQWFWWAYPGKMIGFFDDDFPADMRPSVDGKPKGQ